MGDSDAALQLPRSERYWLFRRGSCLASGQAK